MRWKEENNVLRRVYTFRDFKAAMSFMVHVALYVEQANHHPTWSNTWNRITVELQTHDAGNVVTEKDRWLATKMDEVYEKYQPQ